MYKNNFKTQLLEVKKLYSFLCKQMLWEVCKIKIREYTIQHCKQKQAIKRNVMKEIEVKIEQKEQELINTNYNHKIQLERDGLVKKNA